jgi:hypothetical protein
MQLSLTELNDLLYCTRTTIRKQEALPKHERTMDEYTLSNLCQLSDKIYAEIDRIVFEQMTEE